MGYTVGESCMLNSKDKQQPSPSEGYWKLVGPAHKRRHLLFVGDDTIDVQGSKGNRKNLLNSSHEAGVILRTIKNNLFASDAFSRYLKALTSLGPTGYLDEIRRFRPGLDYTVAHMGVMSKEARLDATLCFVNPGENKPVEEEEEEDDDDDDDDEEDTGYDAWDGGDIGGYECYIAADNEELEAAEVFQQEQESDEDEDKAVIKKRKIVANNHSDTGSGSGSEESDEDEDGNGDDDDDDGEIENQLLSISPGNNVLSLVMRNENIMRFIKYVGANAPGSRWDIAMDYKINNYH